MNPEAKTRFDKAAAVLGLDEEAKTLAWRRIGDLQLSADDPTVIFIALAGVLEKAAVDVPAAMRLLPERVEEAARRAVGEVSQSATAAVRADMAETADLVVGNAKSEIQAAALAALRGLALRERVVAPLLVILLALGVGVIALGAGYGLGRADGASIDRRWQALALRADAVDWLGLISANSDVGRILRENCGAGGKAAYLAQGARACTIPLWLDGAPAPVAGAGPIGWAGFLKVAFRLVACSRRRRRRARRPDLAQILGRARRAIVGAMAAGIIGSRPRGRGGAAARAAPRGHFLLREDFFAGWDCSEVSSAFSAFDARIENSSATISTV